MAERIAVPKLCDLIADIYRAGRVIGTVETLRPPRPFLFGDEKLKVMYHTTSCRAATSIARHGFDLSHAASGAFGVGVNLGSTTHQALLYTARVALYNPTANDACTLVCVVAPGRTHANNRTQEGDSSVPVHVHPKPGFQSMTGAGGTILVVADPRRVMPVFCITHRVP